MDHTVGRSWFVKIIEGRTGYTAEFGTHHVSTGTSIWGRRVFMGRDVPKTEGMVLDALYEVVLIELEARSHVG